MVHNENDEQKNVLFLRRFFVQGTPLRRNHLCENCFFYRSTRRFSTGELPVRLFFFLCVVYLF